MSEHTRYGVGAPLENRRCERFRLDIPGQLFNPATDSAVPCEVLNLSLEGAGLACRESFSPGIPLVLYIDGFGRFEGTVIAHQKNLNHAGKTLGLAFHPNNAKKARISDMLKLFLRDGLRGVTQLRQAKRVRVDGMVEVLLSDGRGFTCKMIDISSDGATIRTSMRPAIGDLLTLGHARGLVVRHFDEGIAVKFVRNALDQSP